MSSGNEPVRGRASADREPITGQVVAGGGEPAPDPGPAEAADLPADEEIDVGRERIALVDLLDRVLAGGVVVAGEVTLSVADVDMVTVSLRALVSSVSALAGPDDGERTAGW